ncbi:SPOR domain-containing protein [candidate division WOR-3 bacterium]|nr:SPOR domain-containing protein [candidate division WOR-3 bacterium]
MKKILLIWCIFLLVVCAPRKTAIQTEGLEEVVVFGEEERVATVSTTPVLPDEEPLLLPPPVTEEIIVPSLPPRESQVPAPPMPPVAAPQKVYGFRVQIFASNSEENASRVAADARQVFGEKVYVDYVAPYYKVRVGDYLTREEIEPLKNEALSSGYRGAFIVETMVTP